MRKIFFLVSIFGALVLMPEINSAQTVDLKAYPAADAKEWGQLLKLKLADQDITDFTNYRSVDEQGISACRYTVAFSSYFLALEQYHKFPAWREAIQPAFDNLIQRMLRKGIWGYWSHESQGITEV